MPFGQATGYACGRRALPWGDDDAHAIMPAASHGSTAGVHHKADQEPARRKRTMSEEEKKHIEIDRIHITDTSKEDDSHALITVHPNKVRKRGKINTEKEQETAR